MIVPPHMLIVGGDEVAILSEEIRLLGVTVNVTRDASDAASALQEGEYRLVLVDADTLPGEPADFVAGLRQRHPDLFLLVTATRPKSEFLVRLIRAGVDDFVSKPLEPSRVKEVLRTTLERGETEGSQGISRANRALRIINKTLREHVSQLTVLYQMGRDIAENENWSDALDRFLMAMVNYARAGGAALLLFSEKDTRLSVRASFQVEPAILSQSCQVLLENWKHNPRSSEIHTMESYRERAFETCLERNADWRFTIIPLRHRNRFLGFLFVEKEYRSSVDFKTDYHLFNTIQSILAGEVANASYISELRQLGRFNQKVLDNIHSGVITTDLEGNVSFFNRRAASMCRELGSKPLIHFNDLFHSHDFPGDFYGQIIGSDMDTRGLEIRYRGDEDVEYTARMNITKMHDDNLNGTVLVAILEDLTERKRLEDQIRRHDRLRVLGQFSAGVAHEIRNPLTGIATSVEVLGGKLHGQEDKLKYIRVVLDEIGRLDEIIRNLLTFARPVRPQFGKCAIADLSRHVAGLLSDEAQKKDIRLEVEDELEQGLCRADANQITQVLLNIILNSIDACDDGDKVKIVLRNEDARRPSSRAFARIDVIDSGRGVPEEVRGSLFEPFVTTKIHGTGLGLAISQQIVEEHSGEIRCDFLEKGTCFTIRLPIETRVNRAGGQSV